jgi:hypothetical protein
VQTAIVWKTNAVPNTATDDWDDFSGEGNAPATALFGGLGKRQSADGVERANSGAFAGFSASRREDLRPIRPFAPIRPKKPL